jgi:hypothetical protein
MLAQVLRLAQAKAQVLLRAVPQEQVVQEEQAVLLLQEVEKVLRQAVAFQQLALQELEQAAPQVTAQAVAVELVAQELELVEVPPQGGLEVLQVLVQEQE